MNTWIVISNAFYYPNGGTSDWRLVTADEAEARAFYESDNGDVTTLVRIEQFPGGVMPSIVDQKDKDDD